jgi:hypothetical protein
MLRVGWARQVAQSRRSGQVGAPIMPDPGLVRSGYPTSGRRAAAARLCARSRAQPGYRQRPSQPPGCTSARLPPMRSSARTGVNAPRFRSPRAALGLPMQRSGSRAATTSWPVRRNSSRRGLRLEAGLARKGGLVPFVEWRRLASTRRKGSERTRERERDVLTRAHLPQILRGPGGWGRRAIAWRLADEHSRAGRRVSPAASWGATGIGGDPVV